MAIVRKFSRLKKGRGLASCTGLELCANSTQLLAALCDSAPSMPRQRIINYWLTIRSAKNCCSLGWLQRVSSDAVGLNCVFFALSAFAVWAKNAFGERNWKSEGRRRRKKTLHVEIGNKGEIFKAKEEATVQHKSLGLSTRSIAFFRELDGVNFYKGSEKRQMVMRLFSAIVWLETQTQRMFKASPLLSSFDRLRSCSWAVLSCNFAAVCPEAKLHF